MANQQQKKSKDAKGSKAGRNRVKVERYMSPSHQALVAERKLRNMLKSNGPAETLRYAEMCNAKDILRRIAAAKNGGRVSELANQALQYKPPAPEPKAAEQK